MPVTGGMVCMLPDGGNMNESGKLRRGHWLGTAALIITDILIINIAAFATVVLRVEFDFTLITALGFFEALRYCCIPGSTAAAGSTPVSARCFTSALLRSAPRRCTIPPRW